MNDRLTLIGDENAKALLRMLLNAIPADRPSAEELLETKDHYKVRVFAPLRWGKQMVCSQGSGRVLVLIFP